MSNPNRPYYLTEVEMTDARTGKPLRGWSVVRNLPDGTVSDWHRAGMLPKTAAQRKRKRWNDTYEAAHTS